MLQDVPFYEESGGGLTLSGGEFLMQPSFSGNVLRAAKEEGLNACCVTTGCAKPEVFLELPLRNLKTAIAAGKDVLPRIPVIPGFNDRLTDAEGLSARLKEVGADRCQLLPFHQFGENKYTLLGKNYYYRDVPALHREELEPYRCRFLDCGIRAFF